MKYKELGIYIHIPFCKSKCYYCDFVSYENKENQVEEYIQQIIQEIKQYDLKKYNVTTIYIGGGTPSYINEKYIKQLLQILKELLENNVTKFKDIEITIEVNPGTITREKLEQYKISGVNRISIGLQSTDDKLLKQIGRIHNYQQFKEAYELVRDVGFENINVDFMIGLPNQTIKHIKQTLEEIKKMNPNHVSIYSLIIEEGTKMEEMISRGELKLPDDELERQMYWYVKNMLELNGYKHYEISNFAKKGYESKHNLNCWNQKEYIGLGVSAHSYLNGVRYSNSSFDIDGKWNFKDKRIEEKQSLDDKRNEYMLLGLRKIDGISVQEFKQKYGENPLFLFREKLQRLVNDGLLSVDGDKIFLTDMGIDFANLVWEEFV